MDIVIDRPLQASRIGNSNKNNDDDTPLFTVDRPKNKNSDDVEMEVDDELLNSLKDLGPTIGEDTVERLTSSDKTMSHLSALKHADALDAIRKLGDAMVNRPADLDPIADPSGYFAKIMSRYKRVIKREGEVVRRLRELGTTVIGVDVVEQILANDKVRPAMSLLSRVNGLEAVEKLASSLENRPDNLDPIADPGGYFLKIVSRYNAGKPGQRKRQRLGSRDADDDQDSSGDEDDDGSDSDGSDDMSMQEKLRLSYRRVGRFKTNFYKSEKTVSKLKGEVKSLTQELEKTRRELNQLKNKR